MSYETLSLPDAVIIAVAFAQLPALTPHAPDLYTFSFPEIDRAQALRALSTSDAMAQRRFHKVWRELRRKMQGLRDLEGTRR